MGDKRDNSKYIYGIDLGSCYTVISKCTCTDKDCKIDILQNPLFHRITPYLIYYILLNYSNSIVIHDKQYFAGEAAQRLQKRYNKEYYTCDLSYLGRKRIENEEDKLTHFPMTFTRTDPMLIRIREKEIQYEELLFFLLSDAKKIITTSPSLREEIELKNYNNFITISVPPFFSNNQINIIKNIGDIMFDVESSTSNNLNDVKSPNMKKKSTILCTLYSFEAIAYAYGYENNDKFNNVTPSYRLFIDMGYSCCTCFLVKYTRDGCKIENCYYDETIGGKYIDVWLYKRLEDKIRKDMRGIDLNNVKYKIAIKNELIKAKEKLSATGASEVAIRIELGDDDFDGTFSVKDIEEVLIKDKKVDEKIIRLTEKAASSLSPVFSSMKDFQIVVVGGSMRIPCIQRNILNNWNRKNNSVTSLTYTLNMDEAVAYGCVVNILLFKNYNFNTCKVNNINLSNTIQDDSYNKNRDKNFYESLKKIFLEIESSNNLVVEGSRMQNDYEALLYKYQHMFEEVETSKYEKEKSYLLEEIKNVHNKPSEDAVSYYNTRIRHLDNQLENFNKFYNDEKDKVVNELQRAIKAKDDNIIRNLKKMYSPYIENKENYSIPQIKQALKEVNNADCLKGVGKSSTEHYYRREDLVDTTVVMGRGGLGGESGGGGKGGDGRGGLGEESGGGDRRGGDGYGRGGYGRGGDGYGRGGGYGGVGRVDGRGGLGGERGGLGGESGGGDRRGGDGYGRGGDGRGGDGYGREVGQYNMSGTRYGNTNGSHHHSSHHHDSHHHGSGDSSRSNHSNIGNNTGGNNGGNRNGYNNVYYNNGTSAAVAQPQRQYQQQHPPPPQQPPPPNGRNSIEEAKVPFIDNHPLDPAQNRVNPYNNVNRDKSKLICNQPQFTHLNQQPLPVQSYKPQQRGYDIITGAPKPHY